MSNLHFESVWQSKDILLAGLWMTLRIVAVAVILSWFVGLVVALGRLSKNRWLSELIRWYVEFFRATPELVQIFWIYYCIPIFFDIRLSSFWSGVLAMTLFGSAYASEIFRAGIQAIPVGHSHAARSLGMSGWQTFHRIVLPQAVRVMIPPFMNHFVDMVKVSALLSTIVVTELMYQVFWQAQITFRGVEFLTVAGIAYFLIIYPFSLLARWFELRLAARL